MSKSVVDILQSDMECEGLLECFHGLKALDKQCFSALVEAEEPLTIDDLAEVVDRERSTVYRAVQRLLEAGFVEKEQINYEHGGYYHVFKPANPSEVRENMQRMLNDWYAKMGQLIQEFENKYDESRKVSVQVEQ